MKFCFIVSGCLAFSLIILFPKEKPVIEVQFPDGFKAAYRKDGTCLAVGPKTVMALVTLEKAKNESAVKSALPEFAKSFTLRSLSFREVNLAEVENVKMPRMYDDGEAVAAEMLMGSGKNSDGDEMFISATAFPWEHRYYVLFAVSKPADKEQLEKERRSVLESVSYVNDD
jgi:alpha-N-acetylglucosamine transferase